MTNQYEDEGRVLLMVAIAVIAIVCLILVTGCAGKGLEVDYTDPQGKAVSLSTDYQIENGFKMERDGEGYTIELGSATTHESEAMNSMMQMMMMMFQMYMPGAPVTMPETTVEE